MLTRATAVGLLFLATILVGPAPAAAGPMTPGERQRLVAHLEMTEDWLVGELDGLSDAQLTFRMTPESWSIKDVAEHLAIAEPQYWTQPRSVDEGAGQGGLEADRPPTSRCCGTASTAPTGSGRVSARARRASSRRADGSLASFRKLRATMLEMAKTSQEDFRGRPFMGGGQDVYQWFLMISTHSQRHILQIREIKAHPKYPKK